MLGTGLSYVETDNGAELLDLSAGLTVSESDFSFNFDGRLVDVREDLDLAYLDRL